MKFDNTFTKLMAYRTRYSFNTIIVIVGDNRTGKSYLGMSLCNALDENFNEKKIIFSLDEFLDYVEKAEPCWLLFDEVGVTFAKSEWWSIENRLFGHVSEAFGKLGINLILTLPSTSMLSTQGIAMTHFFIVMKRRGIGKVYVNWKNPLMGKTGYMTIGHIVSDMPSKKMINSYEKKKDEFLKKKSKEWKTIYKAHQLGTLMKAKRMISTSERTRVPVKINKKLLAKYRK